MAGVAQGLGPVAVEHRGQLAQRHPGGVGIVRLAHKVHRAHLHGKVVFAQHMVEHDERHVARVVLVVAGDLAAKADLQRRLPAILLQRHQHFGRGQLKAFHADGKVRLRGALAERTHAVVRQRGCGRHHLRQQRKPLDAAVGRDDEVHHGIGIVTGHLQRQAFQVLIYQRIGGPHALAQRQVLERCLGIRKRAPEGADGGRGSGHRGPCTKSGIIPSPACGLRRVPAPRPWPRHRRCTAWPGPWSGRAP